MADNNIVLLFCDNGSGSDDDADFFGWTWKNKRSLRQKSFAGLHPTSHAPLFMSKRRSFGVTNNNTNNTTINNNTKLKGRQQR